MGREGGREGVPVLIYVLSRVYVCVSTSADKSLASGDI